MGMIDCVLKLSISITLLVLTIGITVTTVYFLIFISTVVIELMINRKNYYQIRTSIEISTNGGRDYQRYFDIIRPDNKEHVFHIKYEITASMRGLLYNFFIKEFPFSIEIPKEMNVSIHEYSGICNPDPTDGLTVAEKTKFSVFAMNKKTETVKIVLKCECCSATKENFYYFKLRFHDNQINTKCAKTIKIELASKLADVFAY
jgi:hypothetical protein